MRVYNRNLLICINRSTYNTKNALCVCVRVCVRICTRARAGRIQKVSAGVYTEVVWCRLPTIAMSPALLGLFGNEPPFAFGEGGAVAKKTGSFGRLAFVIHRSRTASVRYTIYIRQCDAPTKLHTKMY